MANNKKILSEVIQLKALGITMIEKATHIEKMLAGEGKPVNTRKGSINADVAKVLANMNKTIIKKRA